ncbi:MAG: 16S rRNA (cytosine(967)-C(5))-methyltransferase RsmB [Lachnospiraceae bacterium]|nr:16S rRNA (cytosine(967)-C(5))-methyltransferase RsmB [Lachnospiraceae bacterium]
MEQTREIVLDGLLTFEKELSFSNKLINDILDKYDYLEARDKAFIKRLFEGCVERRIELDYHIGSFSSLPVNKMKPLIRNLLRMGTYQILYMDNIPDRAAINEAVSLAKKRGFSKLSGFVNAILRKVSSNKENLSFPDSKKEPVRYLSVKYSVPEWICEKWMKEYGNEEAEKILESLLLIRPVSIRFKRDLSPERIDELVSKMQESGVSLEKDDRLSYVYRATHIEGIKSLPGYEDGLFAVQDISSSLAIEALEIKEGDTVYDACAAPGGKSILAAEIAGSTGRVISNDVSEDKVALIEENALRMKAGNITARVFDATDFDGDMEEKADCLILDVPCSGLGILGKKRDIKYNASPDGLKELSDLQFKIVNASYKYVKKGGKLLYSTCTINKNENEKQIERICDKLPFKVVKGPVQLLPHRDNCDGFFYCVLERTEG